MRGQVGLPRAAGPRQHQAPVFQKQADVVLHHGLGDEGLKHHAVHTLVLQPCRGREGEEEGMEEERKEMEEEQWREGGLKGEGVQE